jgi:hypothetical protein
MEKITLDASSYKALKAQVSNLWPDYRDAGYIVIYLKDGVTYTYGELVLYRHDFEDYTSLATLLYRLENGYPAW